MRKVLLIDNYDSFTYNLLHLCHQAAVIDIEVRKNDKISISEINFFDAVVISPGPDLPSVAGITLELIEKFADKKPIMGICLGHQAIASVFGASLKSLVNVCHGQQSLIYQTKTPGLLFDGIPDCFPAGRYHSWIASNDAFPDEKLLVTSRDAANNIMSLQHRFFPVFGVQFHPESMMTPHGLRMMENFFRIQGD